MPLNTHRATQPKWGALMLAAWVNVVMLTACGGGGDAAPLTSNNPWPSGNNVSVWNAPSQGEGRQVRMAGVAVASNGQVYVSEYYGPAGVRRFNSLNDLLTQQPGTVFGTALGLFDGPGDLKNVGNEAVATHGDLVAVSATELADEGQLGQVYVYDNTGTTLHSVLSTADGLNFHYPRGLAFDQQGALYIADDQNNRVVKCTHPLTPGTCSTFISQVSLGNNRNGYIKALAQDPISKDWYVADFASCTVRVFSEQGVRRSKQILGTPNQCPIDLTLGVRSASQKEAHLFVTAIDNSGSGGRGKVYAFNANGTATTLAAAEKIYADDASRQVSWGDGLWGVAYAPNSGALLVINSNGDNSLRQSIVVYQTP